MYYKNEIYIKILRFSLAKIARWLEKIEEIHKIGAIARVLLKKTCIRKILEWFDILNWQHFFKITHNLTKFKSR